MDQGIGRVLDAIEDKEELDNTLVFYVLADNGASAEGLQGTISELLSLNGLPNAVTIEDQMKKAGVFASQVRLLFGNMVQQEANVVPDAKFFLRRIVEDVEGDLVANTSGTQEVI